MEAALKAFSAGQVTQPVRTAIEVTAGPGFFGLMPAFLHDPPALGAKLVTVFHGNERRGLTSHLGTILLLDPETGAMLSIMDGRYITAVRTAAVSAVAARYLARRDASTLGIIGSGVQARSHLEALGQMRSLREVRAWSPTAANLTKFVSEAPAVRAVASAEEAVRGAGIIVIATSASTPVVQSEWVADGALVISLGAYRPNMREMDPELTARSRLFVDSRAAALQESGDVLLGIQEGRFTASHIMAELGEVAAGKAAGRANDREVTIFKSLGLAVEDVAAAKLVYDRARQLGKGIEI
jgi:ornithine cyclodeaminase/alanine dehydrogenase-like protein (mu-crystallin family)